MQSRASIDKALAAAMACLDEGHGPPKLAAAMRHAVFPGGARIRPQLCLAVAGACGNPAPALSMAVACAIELLHCASLVHDDLPCFDDAPTRRGLASVHRAFGERLAVLAGDGLIVLAFQALGQGSAVAPQRLAPLLATLACSVGAPAGITAGQGWECEAQVDVGEYQRAKTGALFAAATMAGAQVCGGDAGLWRALGERLGEAYQVADDIRDASADPRWIGKPVGRDRVLGRPSVAVEQGLSGAVQHFDRLVAGAVAAVPACPGASALRALVRHESERLVPLAWSSELLPSLARVAA